MCLGSGIPVARRKRSASAKQREERCRWGLGTAVARWVMVASSGRLVPPFAECLICSCLARFVTPRYEVLLEFRGAGYS